MQRRGVWVVPVAGGLLVAVFLALSLSEGLDRRVPLFLSLFFVAFASYLAAVGVALSSSAAASRGTLLLIFGVAAVARLVLVPADPALSTDIHRYVWEGRVVIEGFNPFAVAPGSEVLAYLRDRSYEHINHKPLATIYPPLAQGIFAAAALVPHSLVILKLIFVVFDLGVILVIARLLEQRGALPIVSVVYAWNPLVIMETAHSGHVDAAGIFFLMLGILLLQRQRRMGASVAMAAAFLVKFTSALLVPFVAMRRRLAPWLLVAAAVAVLAYLPFADAGTRLFASLRIYGDDWQFNGFAYRILSDVVGDGILIRRLLAALVVIVSLVAAYRERDVLRYTFVVIATALLCSPTLYPWYVLWIVPFLCFYPNRPWILFTGLVALSYWVWVGYGHAGEWRVPELILAMEYVPFYVLLVAGVLRRNRREAQ